VPQKLDFSYSPPPAPPLNGGGALLNALVVCLSFGRRRERVREVEAQVIPADDLVLEAPVEQPALAEAASAAQRPLISVPPEADETDLQEAQPEGVKAEPVPATPSVSTEDWICEIALWRDQDAAVFYARSFHDGIEIPVSESAPFTIGADGPLKHNEAASSAHRALCQELASAGWRRVEPGSEWYSDRFRRDFSLAALNASLKSRIVFARRP